MANLWRLTRNDHARRAYDALKRVGITATRMYEYVASSAEGVSRDPPAGVTIGAEDPDSLAREECPALPEHRDDETVLVARERTGEDEGTGQEGTGQERTEDGEVLGYLFVSPAPTIHVHPLETDLSFDGAYVRRVFVHPDARNRGVATALVARTRTLAHEWGLAAVHALVALDNRPSQWTFEANAFEKRHVHTYLRVVGYRRRTVSEV